MTELFVEEFAGSDLSSRFSTTNAAIVEQNGVLDFVGGGRVARTAAPAMTLAQFQQSANYKIEYADFGIYDSLTVYFPNAFIYGENCFSLYMLCGGAGGEVLSVTLRHKAVNTTAFTDIAAITSSGTRPVAGEVWDIEYDHAGQTVQLYRDTVAFGAAVDVSGHPISTVNNGQIALESGPAVKVERFVAEYDVGAAVAVVEIVDQPADQVSVYNTVDSYDISALFSDALSYSVSSTLGGFTIDGNGVVSYDGSLADPGNASVTVTGYPEASQGGTGVALDAYNHRLDLPVAAVVSHVGRGFATEPESTLKQDGGLDGAEGWTWELLTLPAGFVATAQAGGLLDISSSLNVDGSYALPWRVFDGTNIITGSKTIVVTVTNFTITNFVNKGAATLTMSTADVPTAVTVGGVAQGALTDQGGGIYTFPVVRSNGTTTLRDGVNYSATVGLT